MQCDTEYTPMECLHHKHSTHTSHTHHEHITNTPHTHHIHITNTSQTHHAEITHITHTSHTHHKHITHTPQTHHTRITHTSQTHHKCIMSVCVAYTLYRTAYCQYVWHTLCSAIESICHTHWRYSVSYPWHKECMPHIVAYILYRTAYCQYVWHTLSIALHIIHVFFLWDLFVIQTLHCCVCPSVTCVCVCVCVCVAYTLYRTTQCQHVRRIPSISHRTMSMRVIHTLYYAQNVTTCGVYRAAKIHRMPSFHRSFTATEP